MKKLFSIIIVFLLLFTFTSCGAKGPDKVVGEYIDLVKVFDFDKMKTYHEGENEEIASITEEGTQQDFDKMVEIFKPYTEKTTYTISETKENNDKATVKVKCKYLDGSNFATASVNEYLNKAFSTFLSGEDMSDEEAYQMLIDSLKNNTDKIGDNFVEEEVTFELKKTDGEWKIVDYSENLANVMLLNYLKVANDLFNY